MPSSLILKLEYAEAKRVLSVWLLPSGRRYDFASVPPSTAAAFHAAFVKGRFFNRHIRGKFPLIIADAESNPSEELRASRTLI
jgi:hypothetical protein